MNEKMIELMIELLKQSAVKNSVAMPCSSAERPISSGRHGLSNMIGEYVIVRCYTAGNWAGILAEKEGNEIILHDARRMFDWFAAEGISLSECSKHGIDQEKSRICESVESVWLEAIEILPCTKKARESIMGAKNAEPK